MEVFVANLGLGFGYLFLFAAFYNGGEFALRPWKALGA